MKRRVAIITVLILSLFLFACKGYDSNKVDEGHSKDVSNLDEADAPDAYEDEADDTDDLDTDDPNEVSGEKNIVEEVIEAKKGFPQHTVYTDGVIKPNHVSQDKLDQAIRKLYDEWKSKYIMEKPDSEGRYYVWYSDGEWFQEGSEEEKIARTVSEAHGYGMLITATMAGYDPESKNIFDGMFHYFEEHRSQINPNLMAWRQGEKNGKTINIGGTDSATDGDMDIAYSLLLADSQWGSDGEINYLAEAKNVINGLMESCVNPDQYTLRVGDWASSDNYNYLTRTSDFMMAHLKQFRRVSEDERWDRVIDKTYSLINEVYETASNNTGLLPDFLVVKADTLEVPTASVLEGEYDGAMNYNSCRTYWRITTDYIVTGDNRAIEQINKLNEWIISTTDGDPSKINPGYFLDGKPIPDRPYTDLSFSAPFILAAMVDADNQQWVNTLWDSMVSKDTQSNYYFSNTIRLIVSIVASGNWIQL